jgi:dephospho-CoA kinase
MKLCGLTGGVGMGKSTAAGFLLEAGARIIDTDDIARELVEPGKPALQEIRRQFGPEILTVEGKLKRDALARLVFSDASARKQLEDILHPRIRERWQKQVEIWRSEKCPIAVVVIPLLFETRAESHFDKILCVACSEISQRERLRGRGWNEVQARQRIESQTPVAHKIANSNYVIWTEGLPAVHRAQIMQTLGYL